MDIRPLDSNDDAEILAAWDVLIADRLAVDPDFSPLPQPARIGMFRNGVPGVLDRRFVAVEDGEVIAVGTLIEADDQPQCAFVGATVLAAHRRRGIGTRMLAELLPLTQRPVLLSTYTVVPGGKGDNAAEVFAAGHGFHEHTRDIQRQLPVPFPEQATAKRPTPGYAVSTYMGELPADLVPTYNRFGALVTEEAPNGEATVQPGEADTEFYARRMGMMATQGMTGIFSVVTHEESGEAAALSEVMFHPGEGHCSVGYTFVVPAHRGHALGIAAKAAAHRTLAEAAAASGTTLRPMMTVNNVENRHMIAINEALGFEVLREMVQLIKPRA